MRPTRAASPPQRINNPPLPLEPERYFVREGERVPMILAAVHDTCALPANEKYRTAEQPGNARVYLAMLNKRVPARNEDTVLAHLAAL